jgi:NAD(P)-dependent dehydrogenase (short-subunit alcohol dehydrogenase family)
MALEDLAGRVAVVTGAGSGIGRSLALHLADEGMTVAAADVEADGVEATAERSPSIAAHVVDVADADAMAGFADDLFATHGSVHLLCNNAGVFQGGLIWERPVEDWDWVMGVNLHGIINGVQAFLPRMIAAGEPGHVVNTASMAGHVCAPFSGPYQVSKFAAYAYSESLGHDLAAVGSSIGVSVLCPSLIATNIGTSGRNRPGEADGPQSEDVAFVETMLEQMTTEMGIDPAIVAGQVIAAVQAGEFFIPTNDDHRPWLENHVEDLLAHRLPRINEYT